MSMPEKCIRLLETGWRPRSPSSFRLVAWNSPTIVKDRRAYTMRTVMLRQSWRQKALKNNQSLRRKKKDLQTLTVMCHGLTERLPHTEDDSRKNVFEARHQKQRSIFGVFNVGFILVEMGRNEPRLLSHCLECNGLNEDANCDLT